MASSVEGCLVNNYASRRQVKDATNKDNEIFLYHNNLLLVKAERGVTLGLIKLIYSSDENNSGILLGVKPRLVNQVPCLITFDSTPLKHDAYDLIVHEAGPANVGEQTNEQPNKTTTNTDVPQSPPPCKTPEKDTDLHLSVMDATSTSEDWPQHPVTSTSSTSSFKDVRYQSGDEIDESLQDVEPPKVGTSVDGGDDSVNERGTSFDDDDDDAQNGNPEPDSTEAMEKVPFYPEQFDFDIKSVTPLQTDNGLRWPCDRCGKHYCSTSHLKRHWILHTDFRPYKCTLCDKSFHFQWDLKRHMTKHTGNKRFKCPHCDKSFNTQKEVKCHSWLHTGQKLYKCQICDHELSSSGNLKVHMRKHTGVKPYKCEFCPRAFYMLGHYQYHKMRHTGIKPYKCDVCGKGFSYSLNLNEHKNIHTGAKPYSCPKCDKKFAHRSTLKQHILVHGGQRPYKCHICSKDFVQSSNYRNHLLTHKGKEERIQKCDLCGKELLSRRWVKKHRQRCINKLMGKTDSKKTKTPKEPKTKHKCETCNRVFTYRANFESHCKKAHKPPEEGEKQEKKNKKSSSSDARRNKVSCPICHKKFLYMKCVKKHLQKSHAGVEMAFPENMQSTSNLKDSSFAITSGEDSRVIIRSTMNNNNNNNDEVTSSHDNGPSTSTQIEVVPIVQPVQTIHIQPSGRQSTNQSSVTFIFVPSTTKPTSPTSKSNKITKQRSIPEAHPSNTGQNKANYTVTSSTTSDKDKSTETGSQAITALKRLSAKVGIQEQFPCLPNTTDKQRQTVRSEHLSALEQLSKRVGDYGSVTLETVTPVPRDFGKLPEQTTNQQKADEKQDDSKDNQDKEVKSGGKDDEES